MPVTYNDEAYGEVMTWTEDTRIEYAPNRKSGKSFERYGKYMVAKTVGESLRLGSYGLDLLFDFEKGLVKAVGGPKRERPPDVGAESGVDVKSLNQTDKLLGKMYAKWKMWKSTFAALEENGFTRQELKELNNDQDPEGGKDSIVVAIGRRKAQTEAQRILELVKKEGDRKIKDEEILSCLRLWGFKENSNRQNVTPDGEKFVYSDTIGMIKMMTCERTLITLGTKRYPEFTQVITRWLRERIPKDVGQEFTYTSININKNYAGRLHRDGNNAGPSFIKAFGQFTGGELNYFPDDDKKLPLEEFKDETKVQVDIKNDLLLFDGNRGHYVSKFEGERYTLVFFSLRTWNKIPDEDAVEARKCGIPLPTKQSMTYAQSLLGPRGDQGYCRYPTTPDGIVASSPVRGATPAKRKDLLGEVAVATPLKELAAPKSAVASAPAPAPKTQLGTEVGRGPKQLTLSFGQKRAAPTATEAAKRSKTD